MADNMTPIGPQPGEDAYAPVKTGGKSGMSRTTKFVIGGVLLVLVLAVAGGAFFVFFGGSSSSDDLSPVAPASSGTASTTTTSPVAPSAESSVAPVEPAPVPLTDVFTFRDIFEPLAKAPATSSSTTTSGTPTSGTGTPTQTSANTILLQDITSVNGEPKAVLVWNGTTYTVGEGEQVGTSPWKVLDIQDDSVIMLYGDVQVPLSIGQSITK